MIGIVAFILMTPHLITYRQELEGCELENIVSNLDFSAITDSQQPSLADF
jgi:DMSO/TMAO reductase YedYZ heme-binding membrane subunit